MTARPASPTPQESVKRMYDALKKISTGYRSPDWFHKNAARVYGLSPYEAMHMAYENMKADAGTAIYRMRRPK